MFLKKKKKKERERESDTTSHEVLIRSSSYSFVRKNQYWLLEL